MPILLLAAAILLMTACSTPSARPAAPAAERQVLISVMSWHTPLGDLNGSRMWQADGYRFARNRAGTCANNWRQPLPGDLPEKLAVGSQEYQDLQERAAAADLRLMREAGFDVALFDMLPWPTWDAQRPMEPGNTPLGQYPTFLRWLRAAEGAGMLVGLFPDVQNRSGDFPKGHKLDADEWTRSLTGALDLCRDAKALWRIDGRPAVFHFGTSVKAGHAPPVAGAPEPDGGWREVLRRVRAGGRELFFIADMRPGDADRQAWDGIADAVHCFCPAAPAANLVELQPVLARAHRAPYVWAVSPGYYNAGLHAWTPPGFRRIHDTYLAALRHGARWLHVMTWNDFAEDTDIAPSAYKGRALLDVHAFYNRWFKEGREPAGGPEHLVVAYPRAIPQQVEARTPQWQGPEHNRATYRPDPDLLAERPGWGEWREPPYRPNLIWWARLDRPRTLDIPGVGRVDLPAGVSMGEVGAIAAGAVRADWGQGLQDLPAVRAVPAEKGVGLQYRYHDLLRPDGRERQP